MRKYEDKTIVELQRVVKTKKSKMFDVIEICEILDILSKDKLLLYGIEYKTDYSVPFSAAVESTSGKLIVNPDGVKEEISDSLKKELKRYDISFIDLYNYMVLFYLLHETTHVIQKIPNLDDYLLNVLNRVMDLKVQDLSQTKLDFLWNNLSYEHHANVMASRTLLDIYSEDSNLRNYAKFFCKDYEALGYSCLFNKMNSPIKKTGKILGIDELIYFDFSRYSLEDRILYGFDISKEEYESLIQKKKDYKILIKHR